MTIKKFLKRLHCLLHDDRTVLHEGENIEEWEEKRQKRYEKEAERQKREQAILATWFLQEEYIHAGWFKRFIWRLRFAFRDTHGEGQLPQLPPHIITEAARCLMPDIIAFYESEEGEKIFEEWKAKRLEEVQKDNKTS